MADVRLDITKDFACTPEKLFSVLSEHESLGSLFHPLATFQRVKDGSTGRNTADSVRRITVAGLVTFDEIYSKVVKNKLLEYTVSGRSPIKDHVSLMRIEKTASGCRLHYTSAYDGKFPFVVSVISPGLNAVMRLAFRRLSKKLN